MHANTVTWVRQDGGVTRFVVVGAGAIGGLVGALLARAGLEVLVVARGEHGEVMGRDGLVLHFPDRTEVVRVAVALGGPEAVAFNPGDVVLLAVKGQDTEGAIRVL